MTAPSLDSLDVALQNELTALAAMVTAWQTALGTPATYNWQTTAQQLQAACARCQSFVDFYRAGKNAQSVMG